jgi:hypothetical protein
MLRDEAERLQLALDGIVANIETLRAVIAQGVDKEAPESRTEPLSPNSDPDSNTCSHPQLRQIDTMGGTKTYCFECGYAE